MVAVFAMGFIFSKEQTPGQTQQITQQRISFDGHSAQNLDAEPTRLTWLTKDAAGFFTFGLVIVGSIQVIMFFIQLEYMRKGMEDATTAARAASNAAIAAKEQVEVAKAQIEITKIGIFDLERAYLDAGPVEIKTQFRNRPGAIVYRPGDPLEVAVTVGMKNTGRTRAAITSAHGEFSTNELGPTPIYNKLVGTTYVTDVSLSAGESEDFPFKFCSPHIGDQFFFGFIEYKDIFKNSHKSKFCVFLKPGRQNGESGKFHFSGSDAWRECD
jgi:hypothetical protein